MLHNGCVKNKRRKRPQASINERIAQLRRDRGMTQRELAAVLNVDDTAVSHWETSLASPSRARLPEIAAALGCTISDLFGEAA